MSGTHLLETDLRDVRERRDITLDHVQGITRIPLDVLKRFEDGQLVGDPTYNDVYLKAFLRSYAKAVGVPQADVVSAFDAQRGGRYSGELHPDFVAAKGEPKKAEEIKSAQDAVGVPESVAASIQVPETSTPPPVKALASPPPIVPPPTPTPISSKRVSPARSPGSRRSFDRNWGTILGLFSVVVVLLGLAVWALVFRTDAPARVEPDADVATGQDTSATGAVAAAARMAVPINLTVTAAGDGLQSFRVSTDGGERSPFWIEQGESQTFNADSSIVLWGEGTGNADGLIFEDAVLTLQGSTWTPQSGKSVRIDAVNGQRLLDSLATVPQAPRPAATTP